MLVLSGSAVRAAPSCSHLGLTDSNDLNRCTRPSAKLGIGTRRSMS